VLAIEKYAKKLLMQGNLKPKNYPDNHKRAGKQKPKQNIRNREVKGREE
jgi:hypothetical protein